MNRKNRKNYFNLIEIALAIGVIAVGLASVIGMFPIAMNTSTESVGDNEVANVAETFINNLQAQIDADELNDWSASGSGVVLNMPSARANTGALSLGDFPAGWTQVGSSNVYKNNGNNSNQMVFLVLTGDSDASVYDGAIVQVWRPNVDDFVIAGQTLNNTEQKNVLKKFMASLMVEVSYPAAKPYDARKTRLYRLDLFNPRYL